MEHIKYDGQFENAMMWIVDERLLPKHFNLTPLELLALTNWEVKCEQRELGVLPSEKECD